MLSTTTTDLSTKVSKVSNQVLSKLFTIKPYPFIKHINQFENIKSLELVKPAESIPSDADSKDSPKAKPQITNDVHTACTMTKKLKSGSSRERSTDIWYAIKNPNIDEKCKDRMNRMIVLTGELFRLLDCNQTKYRILDDGKMQYPISKGIKSGKVFFDFFFDTLKHDFRKLGSSYIYIGNSFKEGMGRGFIGKYFYMDNDFHADNAFVGNKNYFYAIDHDQCFWPFSRKLRKKDLGESSFIITKQDYNSFPCLVDGNPNHWLAKQQGAAYYFKSVASEPLFNNEKHFSVIKLLVTQELQEFLVNYHIDHLEDRKELIQMIQTRILDFKTICAQSAQFNRYLNDNSLDIIRAIIFEVNEFFKTNKKYAAEALKWTGYVDRIIKSYSSLLEEVIRRPLSDEEKLSLKQYANAIFSDQISANEKMAAFSQAEKFYEAQKMHCFAEIARDRNLTCKSQPVNVAMLSL